MIYPMGEGGFLSGLWKVAEVSGTGLVADFRKVPVRQETVELLRGTGSESLQAAL